jgi:HSP20 family protein
MTLLRYHPWTLVGRLHRDLDEAAAERTAATFIPRIESRELEDRYQLRADLPGVQPQDIEVTTEEGVLALKAQRRSWDKAAAFTYQRRFALPEDANAEAIEARSSHGVLEIDIAKQPKAQPRRIQVAAA